MSNRYRDASLSPEERTEDLLAQMTLDEKLAQLQCHFFAHGDLQKDTRYGIGQISTLEFRQALSLEEAAGIQREIQETVMNNSRFGIPAVFHMEGVLAVAEPGPIPPEEVPQAVDAANACPVSAIRIEE